MTYNISRVGLGLKVTTDTGPSYYFANYSVVANPDAIYPATGPGLLIRSAQSTLPIAFADLGTIGGVAKAATVVGVLDQIALLGAVVTPSAPSVSSAGTITAGASFVSVANTGSSAGTVLGAPLPAGATITFPSTPGQTYGPIAYDATGTTFVLQQSR